MAAGTSGSKGKYSGGRKVLRCYCGELAREELAIRALRILYETRREEAGSEKGRTVDPATDGGTEGPEGGKRGDRQGGR